MTGLSSDGFKRKTYTEIIESMEAKAKELFGENINLSERSPMGLFIRSIAWEMAMLWGELENTYLNSFAINATGIALDNVVWDFGRTRFGAIAAQGKVRFEGDNGTEIPIGFVVGTKGGILFSTTKAVTIANGEAIVDIVANEPGVSGNVPAETITEIINPIAGVSSVSNIAATTGGTDAESDASLRERHLSAIRKPTTGDNEAQYKAWAKEVQGVGNVKVKPTTPSAGYTTIIITDSSNNTPSQDLLDKTYNYIDSVRPVNAGIYVNPAVSKTINVNAKVMLAAGYTISQIQSSFTSSLQEYFSSISLKETYVSLPQIGVLLLGVDGVIDYSDLKLNDTTSNIPLADAEIPAIGTIELVI